MRFETTVQRPVEAKGVGLHSGVPVSIRILPAPPSTGIVFLRTDLDNFSVPAIWRYVAARQLCHQPDAAGRADFHHRASAQRVLQHGRGQCVRRDRQPGSSHPGRQRVALCGAVERRGIEILPPAQALPPHSPPGYRGGRIASASPFFRQTVSCSPATFSTIIRSSASNLSTWK